MISILKTHNPCNPSWAQTNQGQVFIMLKGRLLLAVAADGELCGRRSFNEGVGVCGTFLMNLLLIPL